MVPTIIFNKETGVITGVLFDVNYELVTDKFKETSILLNKMPDTVENVFVNYKVIDNKLVHSPNFNPKFYDDLKEIAKNKLRNERKPLLEALDVEYIRALENNEDTTEILSKKQELRDITKKVPEIKEIKQIKTITLDQLK